MLPSTSPASTAERAMPIVRKRDMMPLVRSAAIEIAVPRPTPAMANSRMPGITYSR